MNALQLAQAWGPLAVAAVGAVLSILVFRRDTRNAQRRDRADLIRLAQEAARATIDDLRIEIDRGNASQDRLRARVEEVEREFADFRRKHDDMIEAKDAELVMLRGEVRQLRTVIDSYQRLMRANGIEPPPLTQQFWSVPSGDGPPVHEEIA